MLIDEKGIKQSPRKNSIVPVDDEKKERANLSQLIKCRIQDFVAETDKNRESEIK